MPSHSLRTALAASGGRGVTGARGVFEPEPFALDADQSGQSISHPGIRALLHIAETQAAMRDTAVIPAAAPPAPPIAATGAGQGFWGRLLGGPWPLLCILAVQAVLSLKLVWSNTAFGDEALYLWAGHLEIANWLHGTRIPAFPTYFSGAPVIYPPIGALADALGGLAAARILSLCFMLGASTLLWATALRLLGRLPAFFATALWATLASTQFLGAFATYDALSLLLLALASWCAVRAGGQDKEAGWITAAAVALAAANATKYASGIFDPVVLALAVLASRPTLTWPRAIVRGATVLVYLIALLAFLLTLGGGEYVIGVTETTLARASGTSSARLVFSEAWQLTAVVVVLAVAGVITSVVAERQRQRCLLLVTLAAAAFLVPIEQARVHTTVSLQKHVDFGAWFAAIAAGYAISRILSCLRYQPARRLGVVAGVAAIVYSTPLSVSLAESRYHDWPNSTSLITALRQVLPGTSGPILVSTPSVAEYYLPQGTQWYRWSNLYTIRQLNGRAVSSKVVGSTLSETSYESRIRQGFFSIVVTNLRGSQAPIARRLVPALIHSKLYRLGAVVQDWDSLIWLRQPQVHVTYNLPVTADTPLGGILTPAPRLHPLLGEVAETVTGSGIAVGFLTLLIRFTWRRRKDADEA